jgi:DNA repair protein RadC
MTHHADDRQVSLLAPDEATLVHLLRENSWLLHQLVARRAVDRHAALVEAPIVRGPEEIAAYLGPEMADLAQEQLRVVLLDSRNRVLGVQLVFQGGLNATVIRLADCFREAIRANAAAIVLVHNHPSGDPTPSSDDCCLTGLAGRFGDALGIDVLDHLIIGGNRHTSLRRLGLYTPPRDERGAPAPHAGDPPP